MNKIGTKSLELSKEELKKKILEEKLKGTSDLEIGKKYGVSFKFIEKVITESRGITVSNLSKLSKIKKIKTFSPKNFKEETTTVWSFKQRGSWATHSNEYRGNWSPYIPRNVILKYSKPGEFVLDYFCGGGTTAIEAKLLGRRFIGIDINPKAIELAKTNVNFELPTQMLLFSEEKNYQTFEPELKVGDARNLSFLQSNSVDLICAHPPYANIIHYTDFKEGDLSFYEVDEFLKEMSKVAKESYRVLKPGRQCAILIGDIRKKGYVIPLGFKLIDVYLSTGFKLKELVIKLQHNCKTTGFWYNKSIKYNFLLLAHEYLPVFEKPKFENNSMVKEKSIYYTSEISVLEEKIRFKKKINKLETTTVWLLPQRDFEEKLNRNIVARYSHSKKFLVFDFVSLSEKNNNLRKETNIDLIFIKSSFLNKSDCFNVGDYLNKIKNIVMQEMSNIIDSGFLVIQTKDVRINGYLEPLAKRIIDILLNDNLYLKEIIIVIPEQSKIVLSTPKEYLDIVHQYLLVYEIKKYERRIKNR
jgi:DNA modification methylase